MSRRRVFISYRREDSQPSVTALRLLLERELGADAVFQDVAIDPGEHFPNRLHRELERARAVLAVIGPDWQGATDGRRSRSRLDDPKDWVRIELEYAVARPEEILVVPILLKGAEFFGKSGSARLPTTLRRLASLQHVRADHDDQARSEPATTSRPTPTHRPSGPTPLAMHSNDRRLHGTISPTPASQRVGSPGVPKLK